MKLPDNLNIGEILYHSTNQEVIEYMVVSVDNSRSYRVSYTLEATNKLNYDGTKYQRTLQQGWNYTDIFFDVKSAYKRSIRLNKSGIQRRNKKLNDIQTELDKIGNVLERLEGEFAKI